MTGRLDDLSVKVRRGASAEAQMGVMEGVLRKALLIQARGLYHSAGIVCRW